MSDRAIPNQVLLDFSNRKLLSPVPKNLYESAKAYFSNRELDLLQTEGLADLINSETEKQRSMAISGLSGKLSKFVNKTNEQLKLMLANTEALIDFADEDLPKNILNKILEQNKNIINRIKKEINNSEISKPIREGFVVSLVGKPNTGKSSFINYISKKEVSIVTNIPGTTTDAVTSTIEIDGYKFTFVDTAGIRKKYKQSHAVEYFSYVRAMHAVDESDIVLMLIDASDGIVDQDLRILNLIRGYGKPVVVALNKIDELSGDSLSNLKETKKFQNSALNELILVEISALQKRGFKKLFNTLARVDKLAKTKFSTGKLNKLLLKFTNATNPPSISGRQIKMRYVHFGGIHPTKFIIHSNFASKIPSNYKRYLINSFREELNLNGVELSIIFKKGDNPYENKKNELSARQIKKKKRLIKHVKKSKK